MFTFQKGFKLIVLQLFFKGGSLLIGVSKDQQVGQKSVNLQYITLGCLDDGTNKSSTKSLMSQVLFFLILFIDLGHLKLFIVIFVFF